MASVMSPATARPVTGTEVTAKLHAAPNARASSVATTAARDLVVFATVEQLARMARAYRTRASRTAPALFVGPMDVGAYAAHARKANRVETANARRPNASRNARASNVASTAVTACAAPARAVATVTGASACRFALPLATPSRVGMMAAVGYAALVGTTRIVRTDPVRPVGALLTAQANNVVSTAATVRAAPVVAAATVAGANAFRYVLPLATANSVGTMAAEGSVGPAANRTTAKLVHV